MLLHFFLLQLTGKIREGSLFLMLEYLELLSRLVLHLNFQRCFSFPKLFFDIKDQFKCHGLYYMHDFGVHFTSSQR